MPPVASDPDPGAAVRRSGKGKEYGPTRPRRAPVGLGLGWARWWRRWRRPGQTFMP